MVTITFNNGRGHEGRGANRDHNRRIDSAIANEPWIDKTKCHDDYYHQDWKDEDPREVYHTLFDGAVERYNAKQKRPERRITDYYEKIEADKQKVPVYEVTVQVSGYDEDKMKIDTQREILKKFVDGWEEANPNLYACGAYFHADEEGQPHCHIDYIPFASGYKNGMDIQASVSKALEVQGFVKEKNHETVQVQWERSERKRLEAICKEYGLTITHGVSDHRKHCSTKQYKEMRKAEEQYLEDLRNQNTELNKQNEAIEKAVQDSIKVIQAEKADKLAEVRKDVTKAHRALQSALNDTYKAQEQQYKYLIKNSKRNQNGDYLVDKDTFRKVVESQKEVKVAIRDYDKYTKKSIDTEAIIKREELEGLQVDIETLVRDKAKLTQEKTEIVEQYEKARKDLEKAHKDFQYQEWVKQHPKLVKELEETKAALDAAYAENDRLKVALLKTQKALKDLQNFVSKCYYKVKEGFRPATDLLSQAKQTQEENLDAECDSREYR